MQVEVITTYFREAFLAPLFSIHYSDWVDRITFLTNKRDDWKFDDDDKLRWVNDAISKSKSDWIILVDMDEFIWPEPYGSNPKTYLFNTKHDLFYSSMSRVWRHHTDSDIDRMLPPVPQRLHGIKDHRKPCVFRNKGGITVGIGNHDIKFNTGVNVGPDWLGSHWANADQCFWIERETRDRGPRLTDENKARGYGTHTLRTKEQIIAECKAHENDPVIIQLT